MKGNELNQNLEVSSRDTFNVLLCGWRKAGRLADSALVRSAAKKRAGNGGRKERREKPPSGVKISKSPGSRSPREAPRREADKKPRLLRTRRSRQPGHWRLAGGRSGSRGRWYPEPPCAPSPACPAIGQALVVGVG